MRSLLLILASSPLLIAPRSADACSPPQCSAGGLAPGVGSNGIVPTVPVNLPGIVWRPMHRIDGVPVDPAKVTLSTDPTTPLALTAMDQSDGTYLLVPQQPLVSNTTYVVSDDNDCFGSPGPRVTFKAGPAAPLPTQLGELLPGLHEFLTLGAGSSGGSCSSEVDAITATISVVLSAEALPWHQALHFETLVDGTPWRFSSAFNTPAPGASELGRGIDRLFHTCASQDMFAFEGLAEGPHEVTMRATLPGTDLQLTLPSVTMELKCPLPDPCDGETPGPECEEPVGAAGGCDASGSRSALWLVLAMATVLALSSRVRSRERSRARSRTRS